MTFQVGAFAHMENARKLADSLQAKGFDTRLEEGRINNRPYVTVYASKQGPRAALEGELFACGVTEPILTGERSHGTPPPHAAPAVTPAPAAPGHGPAMEEPAPAKTFNQAPTRTQAAGKTQGKKSAKTAKRPAPAKAQPAAKAAPARTTPKAGQPAASGSANSPAPRVSGTLPVVEPAPALPDGYVPPPKASGS
jgi:hypothetical protein